MRTRIKMLQNTFETIFKPCKKVEKFRVLMVNFARGQDFCPSLYIGIVKLRVKLRLGLRSRLSMEGVG